MSVQALRRLSDPSIAIGGLLMVLATIGGAGAAHRGLFRSFPPSAAPLVAAFVVGALLAVSSPTRRDPITSLRLYQTSFGVVTTAITAIGLWALLTTPYQFAAGSIIVGTAVLAMSYRDLPWGRLQGICEEIHRGEDPSDGQAVADLFGSVLRNWLSAAAAVVAVLITWRYDPNRDPGNYLIWAGLLIAGFTSPWTTTARSGGRRISRMRKLRLGAVGVAAAGGGLYWLVVTGNPYSGGLWLGIAAAMAAYGTVIADWEPPTASGADSDGD